jgi:hypothetical protein
MVKRYELSDAQWRRIEGLLPCRRDRGPGPCIRRGETVARRHPALVVSVSGDTGETEESGAPVLRQSGCDRSTILAGAGFWPDRNAIGDRLPLPWYPQFHWLRSDQNCP